MKQILIIAAALLIGLIVTADASRRRLLNSGSSGGGGGGGSYLLNTDFEGTGTPSGWTVASGSPNFDNTTSPLAGSQDLAMTSTTACYGAFATNSTIYVKFLFKKSANPGANQGTIYFAPTTPSSSYVVFDVSTTGQVRVSANGGSDTGFTTDTMSDATLYYVWIRITRGSGTAIYEVEFATTDSRIGSGNKYRNVTTGTADFDFAVINPYMNWGGGQTIQIDNVQVSSTGYP